MRTGAIQAENQCPQAFASSGSGVADAQHATQPQESQGAPNGRQHARTAQPATATNTPTGPEARTCIHQPRKLVIVALHLCELIKRN